jgi:thioredoxin 1
MPYATHFELVEPTRAQIDALREPTVLEFGTEWCGYCQAAAPLIEQAFQSYANVRHM